MILVIWIVFGGIVGWIASMITHNNKGMGIISNIIVGLIGSALGGWIASLIGWGTINKFSIGGMIIAILGTVLLLSVFNLIRGKR